MRNVIPSFILWCGASLFLFAGVILWFWPQHEIVKSQYVNNPDDIPEEKKIISIDTSFFERFDLSGLPKPVTHTPPPPPVDPIAPLRGWILVGVIESNERTLALVARGPETKMLEVGGSLVGFSIETITPRKLTLIKGTLHHELTMPPPSTQRVSLNRSER